MAASTQTFSDSAHAAPSAGPGLLISLLPLSPESLEGTLNNILSAFPGQNVLVATPDPPPQGFPEGSVRVVGYTPAAPAAGSWVLTAADFLNTYKLLQEHRAPNCLILGAEAQSLSPEALHNLATSVTASNTDLTTSRYSLGARDALVNSAILYPLTRAVFGTRPRYPLAIDLALSSRMAERLAMVAQRFTASGQNSALIWPVAEAATAGYNIAEVPVGPRALPPPDAMDLNSVLAQVAGSLFSEIEARASFWQRARLAYTPKAAALHTEAASTQPQAAQGDVPDVQPMLDSFRLAYSNLQEIWSLVLPPNSLLGL